MIAVQSGIPATFTVGDAISFTVTDVKYPAGTWTAKIVFKEWNGAIQIFNGSASGTDHLFVLTNANTGKLIPGQNLVCLQFSDGTNRQSTDWTEVEVLADPAKTGSPSFAQQQVSLLQTVIAKLQQGKFQSVNFNGQSFTQASVPEYQKQLTYWEARLIQGRKKERGKRGIRDCSGVSPAFTSPTESIPPFNVIPR